ncbi:GNAT family protein, partial [Nocardioides sp.]
MVLSSGTAPKVTLRPLKASDVDAWRDARRRNAGWLSRWDATAPPGADAKPVTFRTLIRRLTRSAKAGTTLPFAVEVNGAFAGQLTVNNIVRGSAQFASVGYWLDREYAGHGVMPRAVALAIDHCFLAVGLHRIEIAIRPENSNSLRVVEKLEIPEVGYAPRFLHIDGDWRDHRLYAITKEDVPFGLLKRYEAQLAEDGGRPEAEQAEERGRRRSPDGGRGARSASDVEPDGGRGARSASDVEPDGGR